MLKLNAGLSRKVGEPDYGSRGASVNLELEVESNLIHDADGLMDRIRRLFTLARQAVDEELGRAGPPAAPRSGSNGNGQRPATASQVRAIRAIAERLSLDPERVTRDAAGAGLDTLTLRQASQLIDELKRRAGEPAGRGNGDRR